MPTDRGSRGWKVLLPEDDLPDFAPCMFDTQTSDGGPATRCDRPGHLYVVEPEDEAIEFYTYTCDWHEPAPDAPLH